MNVIINSESNETQQQTVSFSDQNQQWTYSIDNQLDDVFKTADTNDATLENFFSRPIKIASIDWGVDGVVGTTINPWRLYFENLRVINRITNYNLLRAKLCVRIMINGNGFHYGRALASYRPLHNQDDMIAWRYGLVPQDAIAASQRMHVWIDPTKSQGGTICLPYVYYKNAMSIPEQDWQKMGELDIASVTTLKHANSGTDGVTISVFAWAEDVSLSIPTIATPGTLSPQSGEYDEALTGPISSKANAVAKAAGAFSKIPSIKPYAMATEMAATAVGKVAKAFGMSRPVDAGPLHSYKPTYAGNMANSNVIDTSNKLTYDVKQELTIDPIATGLGRDDEMTIASIASRESYLTQFAWNATDAPETLLWNGYVEPMMFDTAAPSGALEYHYTPMAWAALPFENWRGTIKYRFQIVASAFHKGRLKIVYEPYFNALGASEYNTQYTHVIDLAKERDFTVEIKWGQEYSFLDHRDLGFFGSPFGSSILGGPLHGQANGLIGVYVVNDLTSPGSFSTDVSVLVSVSAGDDFEVVNPRADSLEDVSFYQPQSGDYPDWMYEFQSGDLSQADADLTTEETKPINTPVETNMGVSLSTVDNTQKVYFGDPVTSVRQILKRYAFFISWLGEASLTSYDNIRISNFPAYRGYASGTLAAMHNAATPLDPTPYNFCRTTPLHWFTVPFLCRRGGIRYKYIRTSVGADSPSGIMSVERLAEPAGYLKTVKTVFSSNGLSEGTVAASRRSLGGIGGAAVTPVKLNPTLEVELPFHNKLRFAPARKRNFNVAGNKYSEFHELNFPAADSGYAVAAVNSYVSVGEDFSLSFFQACPVFWRQADPSPSVTE